VTKQYLDATDVAKALDLSKVRVYQLAIEGRLPCIRRGRRVLFPRVAWERWLERQAEQAMAAAER